MIRAMGLPRLLQIAGLLTVTFVMLRSYVLEPSMLFQFGGLALGAGIFWLGVVSGRTRRSSG